MDEIKRSLVVGAAGALLGGIAICIVRSRRRCGAAAVDPIKEVERMKAQTFRKIADIQRNIDDFRQVLTRAATLEPASEAGP